MRIYLDVCCLGRVFEEDEQPRIRAERAAVESILDSEIQIVTSDAVAYEIARDPDEERRDAKTILDDEIRDETVKLTDSIKARAKQLGALRSRRPAYRVRRIRPVRLAAHDRRPHVETSDPAQWVYKRRS